MILFCCLVGRRDRPGELSLVSLPAPLRGSPCPPCLPQGPQTGGPWGPPRCECRGQTCADCQPTLTFAFSKKPKEKPTPSVQDTGTDTWILWFGVFFFFSFFSFSFLFFPPFLCFFVFLQGRKELFKPLLLAEFFWAQQRWVRLKGGKKTNKAETWPKHRRELRSREAEGNVCMRRGTCRELSEGEQWLSASQLFS